MQKKLTTDRYSWQLFLRFDYWISCVCCVLLGSLRLRTLLRSCDGVPVLPSDTVRSYRSSSTSTSLYVAASINCDSYGQSESDDPFQMTRRHMRTPVHAFVKTTVTLCCTASQQKSLVGCRQYYSLPLDWSLVFAEISTHHWDTAWHVTLAAGVSAHSLMFKIALTAFDCVHGQGPGYFDGVMTPVHTVAA